MEFRLGNQEIFWEGKLELPCPTCHTNNLKTSDHSSEVCISCKRWFNWRYVAFRMFREQVEVDNPAARRPASPVISEVWNPSDELRAARPRVRDLSGRYVRTPGES